jgi:HEAT repeat protein
MGSSQAKSRHSGVFIRIFKKADVDRTRMRPLAKHIGLAAASVALLFVTRIIGSSLNPAPLTQFPVYQQNSSSTDSEVAHWLSQLKSSSEEERREAAMQLARPKSEAAFRALASAVNDRSPQVRAAVVASLAERGDESAVPIISVRLATDKDQFVRKAAAYALGRFHEGERTAALTGALRDKDPEVRAAAATSLGDHPDHEAVAPLASALSDKNDFVRAQAARALGVNGSAAVQTVPALIALLTKEEDAEVKRQAASALGQIGDRSALPALERARHDKDPYLAQAASDAIKVIERK